MRDALGLDERQRSARAEGPHQDDRATDEYRRQHRDPADVRKQSQGAERSTSAAVTQRNRGLGGPAHAARVRVDDSLGQCRGSGAVDDVALVVRCDRRWRGSRGCGCRERVDIQPFSPGRVASYEVPGAEGIARAQCIDAAAVRPGGEDGGTVGVGAHARHGRVRNRDIQRNGDRAGADDPEENQHRLDPVFHQRGHGPAPAFEQMQKILAKRQQNASGLGFVIQPPGHVVVGFENGAEGRGNAIFDDASKRFAEGQ